MVFGVSYDDHFSSVGFDDFPLRNCFSGVISSFRMDMGFQVRKQRLDGVLFKLRDKINFLEGCDNFNTFFAGDKRSTFAL